MMLRCSMSPRSPRRTEMRSRSVSCSLSNLSLYCRTCMILCDGGCAADAVGVSDLMRQATSCRLVSDPMACPGRGCTCYKIAHRSCRTISRTIWSGWESHRDVCRFLSHLSLCMLQVDAEQASPAALNTAVAESMQLQGNACIHGRGQGEQSVHAPESVGCGISLLHVMHGCPLCQVIPSLMPELGGICMPKLFQPAVQSL